MLVSYPDEYDAEAKPPSVATITAVLGDSHHDAKQYDDDELALYGTYHKRFKLGSKPAAHIDALAQLSDKKLLANMPESLKRLADAVIAKLEELPE
jgi:hypothetical protein